MLLSPIRLKYLSSALLLALVAFTFAAQPTFAQSGQKPNPETQQEREAREAAEAARRAAEAARRAAEAEAARSAAEAALRRDFIAAYEAINSPRLLLWASVSEIGGKPRPLGWENDRDSLLSGLSSRLARMGVELIDADSLGEADRRSLGRVGEPGFRAIDFVRSLGQQADMFVHLQLRPASGDQRYRVLLETTVIASQRRAGSLSVDWVGGDDAVAMDRGSEALLLDWMRDFLNSYRDSQVAYRVVLLGIDDPATIRKARDAFQRIPGVRSVIDRQFTAGGEAGAFEMSVRYAGRPLDFVTDLAVVSERELSLIVKAQDLQAGAITLTADDPTKPKRAKKRSPGTFLAKTEEGDQARAELATAYEKQGRPRIAVIVNREVTAEEARGVSPGKEPAGPAPVTAPIQVQFFNGAPEAAKTKPDEKAASTPPDATQGDEALNARSIEAEFFKICKENFNFRMVDAATVRAQIQRDAQLTSQILGQEEAAALIRLTKDADVVILGSGRFQGTVGQRQDEAPWVHYTFRAIRVSDGAVLAAENRSAELRSGDKTSEDIVRQAISKDIAAGLVQQMMQSWTPPNQFTVTVTNAKTTDKVFSIMSSFARIDGMVSEPTFVDHNAGAEGGLGRFEIRFEGAFEDLIKAIESSKDSLPFDLATQNSSRDKGLTVRVKDGM